MRALNQETEVGPDLERERAELRDPVYRDIPQRPAE